MQNLIKINHPIKLQKCMYKNCGKVQIVSDSRVVMANMFGPPYLSEALLCIFSE